MNAVIPMNDPIRAIRRDRGLLEEAFADVLDSGWLVLGPRSKAFEIALAEYSGTGFAIGVASGTDALELALKAVMPAGRQGVLTAANAGAYTSVAARRAGFDVSFADVDAETLCLSRETVRQALTPDVGVVVVTHLYGNLTDIQALVDDCHSLGIMVVEDCAQALGARRPTGAAGSFGDAATISFYPTKNLGALGDGGAVLTSSAEHADRVRQLRQYGWGSKYDVQLPGGMNSRLDELQAAFLAARLPQLNSFNARRRYIIGRYVEAARGTSLRVLAADGEHHAAHLAVALSPQRAEVRAALLEQGVQTDIHFPIPDYRQPGLGATDAVPLPVTEQVSSEVFSLPCFEELTDAEVDAVCAALANLV
jgi:aminotransferase EvaB